MTSSRDTVREAGEIRDVVVTVDFSEKPPRITHLSYEVTEIAVLSANQEEAP